MLVFKVVGNIGGLLSGPLALLANATHMATDAVVPGLTCEQPGRCTSRQPRDTVSIIAGLILRASWLLLREFGYVLLKGIPPRFDQNRLKSGLPVYALDIIEVHHILAWALIPGKPYFLTMHVTVYEQADANRVLSHERDVVRHAFEIKHVTIQIEWSTCPVHESC